MPQQAITRIHVEGFRSLREVTLEPGRITVLIGANGSGKSNLLSLFRLIQSLQTKSLRRFVGQAGGASALLHRGRSDVASDIFLELEFTHAGHEATYGARFEKAGDDQLMFVTERIRSRRPNDDWKQPRFLGEGHFESRISDEALKPKRSTAKTIRGWFRHMAFYHFHDTSPGSALRSNARAIEHRVLLADGRNLAAYLLALKQSGEPDKRAAWRLFQGLIRQVAPFIKELDPTPVNADPVVFRFDDPHGEISKVSIRLEWVDENDNRFGVDQLSDGTLRAIALFAALTQTGSALPRFISIDEPELGLHPAALQVLAALVRSVAHRCQVLIATQSPALLDLFDPKDVVVAERRGGATELHRLDTAGLAAWLKEYSLAQLFDKNLLGGRP